MHETVFNYFLRADSGPDNDNVPNYLQIGDKTRSCFIRLKHTDRNATFTPWSLLRPVTNLFWHWNFSSSSYRKIHKPISNCKHQIYSSCKPFPTLVHTPITPIIGQSVCTLTLYRGGSASGTRLCACSNTTPDGGNTCNVWNNHKHCICSNSKIVDGFASWIPYTAHMYI